MKIIQINNKKTNHFVGVRKKFKLKRKSFFGTPSEERQSLCQSRTHHHFDLATSWHNREGQRHRGSEDDRATSLDNTSA